MSKIEWYRVYRVFFESGWTEDVICNDEEEAKIIAQANRISHNLTYKDIKEIKYLHKFKK